MQVFVVDKPAAVWHKMGHSMGVPFYGNEITKSKVVINFQPV